MARRGDLWICKSCENTSKYANTVTPGSFIVELALWLLFCLPGLIYSCWRIGARYGVCPHCGGRDSVPVNSPAGQRILASRLPPKLQ
jgi:hypothetical protein